MGGYLMVKPSAISNTTIIQRWLSLNPNKADFVLYVGDAIGDGEVFNGLHGAIQSSTVDHPAVFSVTLGRQPCKAAYYLSSTDEIAPIINGLLTVSLKEKRNRS